jgi:hypothetical protein
MKSILIVLLFSSTILNSQRNLETKDSTKVNQTSIQIINKVISKLDSCIDAPAMFHKDSIISKDKSIDANDSDRKVDSISVNKKNTDKKKVQSEINIKEETITNKSFFEEIKLAVIGLMKFIKNLLLVLFFLFSIFYIFKKYKKFRDKISFLVEENQLLKGENKNLNIDILNLKKTVVSSKINGKDSRNKSIAEKESMKQTIIKNLCKENNLDGGELTKLKENQENRWVTIGHSAIGKNHTNTTPIIPCQDNNHFESLSDKFELAIVCDGAGSAKMSHFGSKFLSQGAIPKNIKLNLENLNWFKNGKIPTKLEWNKLSKNILKQSYTDLKIWINRENKKNNTNFSVNEFASTVIITIYNSKGVLVANIGDGRAGYLNNKGQLQPLFTPYGGEESNGTIFITSPIWDEPENFIQSNVFSEFILSVFLLSDGMEKSTFECSNLTNDVFVDPNIPYKKFFLPVFSKIKSISTQEEEKLSDEWKKFLESGTEAIKNEGDDKTLVISFLK